jgi:hypothetical protein
VNEARLLNLKKEMIVESWTPPLEKLIKNYAEKAAGLRLMHLRSSDEWSRVSNWTSIVVIVLSTIGGMMNFGTSNDYEHIQMWMYFIGIINITASMIASVSKFYKPEEKEHSHLHSAQGYGVFHRELLFQLNLPKSERKPAEQVIHEIKNEYNRIQNDELPLKEHIVNWYKSIYMKQDNISEGGIPDIARLTHNISILTE